MLTLGHLRVCSGRGRRNPLPDRPYVRLEGQRLPAEPLDRCAEQIDEAQEAQDDPCGKTHDCPVTLGHAATEEAGEEHPWEASDGGDDQERHHRHGGQARNVTEQILRDARDAKQDKHGPEASLPVDQAVELVDGLASHEQIGRAMLEEAGNSKGREGTQRDAEIAEHESQPCAEDVAAGELRDLARDEKEHYLHELGGNKDQRSVGSIARNPRLEPLLVGEHVPEERPPKDGHHREAGKDQAEDK